MKPIKSILKFVLWTYTYAISPIVVGLGGRCRFHPSCSEYARGAIEKYPATKAILIISHRLMCCNPLHPGGVDEV